MNDTTRLLDRRHPHISDEVVERLTYVYDQATSQVTLSVDLSANGEIDGREEYDYSCHD